MAHYALLDENNVVRQIITGVDEEIIQQDLDGSFVGGSSEAWEEFYASRPWFSGMTCKRTSYNGNIRKRYAGIGMIYNPDLDAFIYPPCHENAILNPNTADWICDDQSHTAIV